VVFGLVVGAATPRNPEPRVTKNKLPYEDRMIISNNKIYILKCYLKFFKIVPVEMDGLKLLATALKHFVITFFHSLYFAT